ncbi:ABC transporter permease [Acidiplasma cupricumulans]|uniref:ABC transporter permease n=1 Tax=Acidiplasma cupricumulans TaxID=312540 RepID=A0A0Q0WKF8_9ARCH|nr:ABC transporter permease [Acidiplasma cupricumulans]KQB36217.1 ABC transporter permease [Acidiplasma cupricumulans]
MSKLLTVYLQYIKNYYRSKSFFLMLFLIIIISAMMVYFSFKYVNDLPKILGSNALPLDLKIALFYFLWSLILLYIPVFASVFFGSPAISSEIENKTAFYIFPLPINRHKLFVGKFLAAFSVTLVIVLIYIIVEAATLSFIFKKPPEIYFYYSLVLLILFVLSMTSLTFMISAIFNKNTYAYISVLLIYYIVFYAGSFIIELLYKIDPFYLLSDAASIIQRVYVNINTEDFFARQSLAPAPFPDIMLAGLIMFVYFVATFVIGLFLFDRKEVQ